MVAARSRWQPEHFKPVALAEVIAARVMHLDGTGLAVLDPEAKGGKKLGALWGSPDAHRELPIL